MKRWMAALTAALLLLLLLPAYAAGGQEDSGTPYIRDQVGILSQSEMEQLEQRAEEIAGQYSFAVNILIVQDYRDYSSVSVYEAAKSAYLADGLGYGSNHDGILLLLSMGERDYANIAYGYGNTAFTDYGKEKMDKEFLDDFGNNNWFDGCCDYLRVSEKYLKMAAEGTPFDSDTDRGLGYYLFRLGLRLLLPLLIAGVYVLKLTGDMKSVAVAYDAGEYIDEGGVHLTQQQDVFTHTTRTERKIERNESGGGGTSVDSGGFSGTSGKF